MEKLNLTQQKHVVGWLEFNMPFQHKYDYRRDKTKASIHQSK